MLIADDQRSKEQTSFRSPQHSTHQNKENPASAKAKLLAAQECSGSWEKPSQDTYKKMPVSVLEKDLKRSRRKVLCQCHAGVEYLILMLQVLRGTTLCV